MALAFIGSLVVPLEAQTITIKRSGEALTVQAPGLGFLKGETLARLKDGRGVRIDLELSVMPGPGGDAAARGRRTFVLSYDLWEERFAVTMAGSPPRSSSYLTAPAAEAWCVDRLTIPVIELGKMRETPFWIRLEFRVLDGDATPDRDEGAGLTLRGLIDTLSRKAKAGALTHAIEAGPFRLQS